MIPLVFAGPPVGFATTVVRPAKLWTFRKAWNWDAPPPPGKANELPAYWTRVLDQLHEGYGGICAYLSVYTHRSEQASSVDHFVPKSKASIRGAYDWSNYRLACRPMNTNKGEADDVLDPIGLPHELFTLDLLSGRVQINKEVAAVGTHMHLNAQRTIKRLKLNAGPFRMLRLEYINMYLDSRQAQYPNALSAARDTLAIYSPFIHLEVVRQGW